jgi:subtilisin family serine protease
MASRFWPRALLFALGVGAVASSAPPAHAQMAGGASLVRLLGRHARDAFARPGSAGIGAIVPLPSGVSASGLGLTEVAPGFARLTGSPEAIVAFGDAHPHLSLEVAPPLHPLLDTATGYVLASAANASGYDGSGVLVGVADTGLDVTHPDFLDAQGNTRVAWLIDYSQPPIGLYPELETKFGVASSGSSVVYGAVWAAADINKLLKANAPSQLPQDVVGHGTMVTACAAAGDEQGHSLYRGVAPRATILMARITGSDGVSIDDADLLSGVAFLFDRADAMKEAIVVNLSLGSDFGPHDGTTSWEQALATYVGPNQPGHAIVAAAGNSGSIVETPVHQNVFVAKGSTVSVPISTQGAQSGGVQVWVAMHKGTSLKVGLDGPDGQWIAPVDSNNSAGKNTTPYDAAIYNGSQPANSPVPAQSNGAAVVWQGQWPSGTYSITLSGEGTADLYVQGTGDAASNVGFFDGVREGTINLPATTASIISVGCTINKPAWRDIYGTSLGLSVPLLDTAGGEPADGGGARDPIGGEPCWFSSAGPTLTGIAKPEIMAPGAAIIGAMSQQAVPPAPASIFTTTCPTSSNAAPQPGCQEIDPYHGISFGTSFSSPIVAGTIALLFQHDPTLTQDIILAALQGGAHPLRGSSPLPFPDQTGPGEVDVLGALGAVDRMRDPQTALPSSSASWMALGADQYLADGSTPLQAVLELRAAPVGTAAPMPADGFAASRLQGYVLVDGVPHGGVAASLTKRGPGVWVETVALPAGLGGSNLTLGARFDGADVVTAQTVPIATDTWNASYPPTVAGSCAVGRSGDRGSPPSGPLALLAIGALLLSARRFPTFYSMSSSGGGGMDGKLGA